MYKIRIFKEDSSICEVNRETAEKIGEAVTKLLELKSESGDKYFFKIEEIKEEFDIKGENEK